MYVHQQRLGGGVYNRRALTAAAAAAVRLCCCAAVLQTPGGGPSLHDNSILLSRTTRVLAFVFVSVHTRSRRKMNCRVAIKTTRTPTGRDTGRSTTQATISCMDAGRGVWNPRSGRCRGGCQNRSESKATLGCRLSSRVLYAPAVRDGGRHRSTGVAAPKNYVR